MNRPHLTTDEYQSMLRAAQYNEIIASFRSTQAAIEANRNGWPYSRYPEDSPAFRRHEKLRRLRLAFSDILRIIRGERFEDFQP